MFVFERTEKLQNMVREAQAAVGDDHKMILDYLTTGAPWEALKADEPLLRYVVSKGLRSPLRTLSRQQRSRSAP